MAALAAAVAAAAAAVEAIAAAVAAEAIAAETAAAARCSATAGADGSAGAAGVVVAASRIAAVPVLLKHRTTFSRHAPAGLTFGVVQGSWGCHHVAYAEHIDIAAAAGSRHTHSPGLLAYSRCLRQSACSSSCQRRCALDPNPMTARERLVAYQAMGG